MFRNFEKIFSYILFATFAIIYLFAYRQWLFSFSILTKGDWLFYIPQALTTLRIHYFSLWLQDLNMGRVLLDVGQAPTYALYGLLAKFLIFDYATLERIVHMWPIIILTPLCSFLLIREIFPKSKLSQLIGTTTYSFNTYFLDLQTGHLTLMAAFAVAPLVLFFYKRFLNNFNYTYGLLTALSLSICCAYEPRGAYVLCFVLFLYAVYRYLNSSLLSTNPIKIIWLFSIPAVVFTLLNFYWAFSLAGVHDATGHILQRGLWGDIYYDITRAFTLFHPWWTGKEIAIFSIQPIPFYFWLIPLFATFGFILNRKNKEVVFYAIIALLGILLTKQSGPPFTHLYEWLYNHFPGFSAYREASKFYFLIALGYSVLIAGLINSLWMQKSNGYWIVIFKYCLTVIIFALFLWNTKPFITGEINSLFIPRTMPEEYSTFNNFLLKESSYFRTIWLPKDPRWAAYTDIHPKISYVDILQENWWDFNQLNRNSLLWPFKDQVTFSLEKDYTRELIDNSSVKYIIVPIEDFANDDDFFEDYGGKENPNIRDYYISLLDSLSYLHRVSIGAKNLVVYQNDTYKPYITSFTSLLGFSSLKNLDNKYSFTQAVLGMPFNFIVIDKTKNAPTLDIRNIFEDTSLNDIASTSIKLSFDTQNKANSFYPVRRPHAVKLGTTDQKAIAQYNGTTTFQNIITNPSFEDGAWQQTVGDCNNYDNKQKIAMRLSNNASDGVNSIELEATAHIACTSTQLLLEPGKDYLFAFDYQSPNAENVGYYFDFDNKGAPINVQIPVKDKTWQNYSKIITVPPNASSASLVIYSYARDGATPIFTRYDNFHLVELPDVINNYWLVNRPVLQTIVPKSIGYDMVSPTKKIVHIAGAKASFYLSMSEAYHDQWQLEVNNFKIQGILNSWVPWAKPDKVADSSHFKLDNFINGWYVDIHDLCETKQLCTKNVDGSYDIEMVIEFWPQRWFYLGLIISGATLAGCLGYLGYAGAGYVRRKYRLRIRK